MELSPIHFMQPDSAHFFNRHRFALDNRYTVLSRGRVVQGHCCSENLRFIIFYNQIGPPLFHRNQWQQQRGIRLHNAWMDGNFLPGQHCWNCVARNWLSLSGWTSSMAGLRAVWRFGWESKKLPFLLLGGEMTCIPGDSNHQCHISFNVARGWGWVGGGGGVNGAGQIGTAGYAAAGMLI